MVQVCVHCCRKVAERGMDIEDLQDVAQLRVIVTMKEGHDSTLYGTGVLRALVVSCMYA